MCVCIINITVCLKVITKSSYQITLIGKYVTQQHFPHAALVCSDISQWAESFHSLSIPFSCVCFVPVTAGYDIYFHVLALVKVSWTVLLNSQQSRAINRICGLYYLILTWGNLGLLFCCKVTIWMHFHHHSQRWTLWILRCHSTTCFFHRVQDQIYTINKYIR